MSEYLEVITKEELENWEPKTRGIYEKIFLAFIESPNAIMKINLEKLREKRPKVSPQTLATAFYNWRRKEDTKMLLIKKGITEVSITKKGDKIALVKVRYVAGR